MAETPGAGQSHFEGRDQQVYHGSAFFKINEKG